MSIRVKDGAGTGNRLAVFNNRAREHEVQQSATNHISTAILNGRTGVFTASNFAIFANTPSPTQNILSITNNDPINLLLLDRIYVQIPTSNITLPNPNVIVGLHRTFGGNTPSLNLVNENRFSRISGVGPTGPNQYGNPAISFFGTGSSALPEILEIFPTVGDIMDLLFQGSNGIILPDGGNPANLTPSRNTISIVVSVTGSFTSIVYAFIKFMMVPPGALG